MKRLSNYFYLLSLIGCLTLGTACSDDKKEDDSVNKENPGQEENEQPGTGDSDTKSEDKQVNELSFSILSDYYLWNDEYKAQKLDYDLDYVSFFEKGLKSLKTNTLDNRSYTVTDENGKEKIEYHLFSYIQEVPDYATTRTSDGVDKEKVMSFGLVGLRPCLSDKNPNPIPDGFDCYVCFIIKGVHPETAASNAGLDRGYIIDQIDGKDIRLSNYEDTYYNLLAPSSASSHSIHFFKLNEDNYKSDISTKTISCTPCYLNPIIKSQVEDVDGHKVGYLCYNSFDAGFDEELLVELKRFKSEGISDLVLDLRYNLGGHVVSSCLLSSAIAGEYGKGKPFVKYRFNDTRMNDPKTQKSTNKLFGEYLSKETLKNSLSQAMLNLNKLYIIVSGSTASSSELVINSLRGIDIDVYLIGQTTLGKNVGMEVFRVGKGEKQGSDLQKTYEIAPITFQSYNAKGFGDYENGFQPDLAVDELNPFHEKKGIRVYRPFGSQREYLYAFALEQITGKTILERPTAQTRGLVSPLGEVIETLPAPQLGTRGMIIYPEE